MVTHPFDRDYFNGGAKVGGYAREGYWDYPVHYLTAEKVMALRPESVLEIGCARGYVLRRLEDAGVRVAGLEISEHCRLTRATENVITHDAAVTPWPFEDQSFDVCLSIAVLEHIPEDKLPAMFAEMKRVCRRGLHGVDLHDDDGFDKTHVTIRPEEWWRERLPEGQRVCDKEELERGQIQLPHPQPRAGGGAGVKLNVGCFTTMFHYGWRNVDVHDLDAWARQYGYRYMRHDVRREFPFDDNVVDLIFSSHFLEHLTYDEGAAFLKECYRVMRPGATIRTIVPDAALLIAAGTKAGTLAMFNELSPTATRRAKDIQKLWELLCEGHRSIYDRETLMAACRQAGFKDVAPGRFRHSRNITMQRETQDMFPDLSLIVEATR